MIISSIVAQQLRFNVTEFPADVDFIFVHGSLDYADVTDISMVTLVHNENEIYGHHTGSINQEADIQVIRATTAGNGYIDEFDLKIRRCAADELNRVVVTVNIARRDGEYIGREAVIRVVGRFGTDHVLRYSLKQDLGATQ